MKNKNEIENLTSKEPLNLSDTLLQKIFLISIALIGIAMISISFSYGISGDEVDMNEYGKTILSYFTSLGSDTSCFRTHEELVKAGVYDYNRDNVVWYYGGLFDLICAIINKFSPLEEYTTRHILNAFLAFVGVYFSGKIAYKIAGTRAAIITVWLMFLSPFFLGHSMNNPKDIPFAATYIIAIYFIIQLFSKIPKLKYTDYLWVILSIGATINIRVGGILLIPYMFVFVFILWFVNKIIQKNSFSISPYIKPIIICSILGYFAGSLLWPYALQNPLSNPLTALSEMGNFKVNIKQVFEGTKIFSGELPIYFLPKSFIITNTFAILIGLALSFVFLWKYLKNEKAALLLFILFTAFFPLAYIIYTKANVYHAWRHVLFIFPSMAILASFGWNQCIAFFEKMKIAIAGIALLFFFLLEPAYFIFATFPNTVTYHNQLVGGVKGAYGKYEVDYYYNSLKQCSDYFVKNILPQHQNGDTVIVMSNALHIMQHYIPKGSRVKLDYIRYYERNQKNWDYLIMHIALIPTEDLQTQNWLPTSTIYKSEVYGKPLCALIKRPSYNDLKAMEMLNNNQIDSALVLLNEYLTHDEKNTDMLNLIANIYSQIGKSEAAIPYIEKSYQIDATKPETIQMMGIVSLQKNDFATAQKLFTQIITENPQYAKAYMYLAMSQLGAGDLNNALSNFNTASQDEQIRLQCYRMMGDTYSKMGKATEANKFYMMSGMSN